MTEYDYSPEAYERYLATQNRIAHWVDNCEQHRAEFQSAVPNVAEAHMRAGGHSSYGSGHKLKRSPPPSPTHHNHHGHSQPPRQLFIHAPPPESESSEEYGDGPGPMPLPSPGMIYAPQAAPHPQGYHPMMGQPMLSPPMMMPPSYMVPPQHGHHKSSHHHHRSHSQHRSRSSHHSSAYYPMASPPVSPGFQYAYPQAPMGSVHPGYIMMPPQPHSRSRQLPVMTDLPQLHSAPPNVTTFSSSIFSQPAAATPAGHGYFQQYSTTGSGPSSPYTTSAPSPGASGGGSIWSTYGAGGSIAQSGLSTPTTSSMSPSPMASPQRSPVHLGIPQYQGTHSALTSSVYLAQPASAVAPPVSGHGLGLPQQQHLHAPPALHQRVYNLSTGNRNKHYLRHSVG